VRDGRPELLVINKGLRHLSRPELFGWHLQIAIPYQAEANGMPTQDEAAILNQVSDAVTVFVLEARTQRDAPNALFFAQSTWGGVRSLHFRVHNGQLALDLLETKTNEQWERDWHYRLLEDPDWIQCTPFTKLLGGSGDEPLR
jgi:hypothetical protein